VSVYPKRPSHFAHRFVRLMMKAVAAQEVGPEGFCLLAAIAMTEDAKRYRGPVIFFNHHLMTVCGFKTEKILFRVRSRCVKAGWLVWNRGRKNAAATYWVAIPEQCDAIEDGPVDEVTTERKEQTGVIADLRGDESVSNWEVIGNQSVSNREVIGQTFIPNPFPLSPFPDPKESAAHAATTSQKAAKYTAEFEEAWQAFKPSHRGGTEKPEAFTEWKKAIRVVGGRDGINEPHLWLMSRMQAYARSAVGQSQYSPAMCRWLKNGRYDDEPAKWSVVSDDARAGPASGKQTASDHNRTSAAKALEVLNAARRRDEDLQANRLLGFAGNQDGTGGDASVD
jgi:hypothetical protein